MYKVQLSFYTMFMIIISWMPIQMRYPSWIGAVICIYQSLKLVRKTCIVIAALGKPSSHKLVQHYVFFCDFCLANFCIFSWVFNVFLCFMFLFFIFLLGEGDFILFTKHCQNFTKNACRCVLIGLSMHSHWNLKKGNKCSALHQKKHLHFAGLCDKKHRKKMQ